MGHGRAEHDAPSDRGVSPFAQEELGGQASVAPTTPREPEAKASGVVAVPVVATSLVTGIRLLLRELGLTDAVRTAVVAADPFASRWIDRGPEEAWCPIDRYLAVIAGLGTVVGEAKLRELGRLRFARAMETGRLAPILRSWERAFQGDPVELVKVAPHLWRGVTQGLGEVRLLEQDDSSACFVFETTHPAFLKCRAWHLLMEGWGQGLLTLARGSAADPESLEGLSAETVVRGGHLQVRLAWRAPTTD